MNISTKADTAEEDNTSIMDPLVDGREVVKHSKPENTHDDKRPSLRHHEHHEHHEHHHHHHHEPAFIGTKDQAFARHPWLVYNEDILRGYRINYHSYKILFKSLGQCHNETTNTWSHLLGAICFAFLFVYFAAYYKPFDLDIRLEEKALRFGESKELVFAPLFSSAISNIYAKFNPQVSSDIASGNENFMKDSLLFLSVSKIVDRMKKLEIDLKTSFANYDQSEMNRYSQESKQFFEDINQLYLQLKERLQSFPEGSSSLAAALRAVKDKIDDHLPIFLEKWPLEIFLFSVVFCFSASSAMHLLWVRSLKVCNLTHNIDLSGISIMIFGSAYGFIYYIFKCDYWSYYIYFSVQLFALLGVLLCINCKIFNKEKYQMLKVVLFMLQASSTMLSALHWRLMKPEKHVLNFWINVKILALEMVTYAAGTFFFVSRFPERKFPGKFDIFLPSHTIFHLFVVAGALLHYIGMVRVYQSRYELVCPTY